jgi:hypothetical protein
LRVLEREWPGYKKPLSRAILAGRIDRNALRRAAPPASSASYGRCCTASGSTIRACPPLTGAADLLYLFVLSRYSRLTGHALVRDPCYPARSMAYPQTVKRIIERATA